ncbi:unnamed protein product [Paramecium sonneborni]|uniref:Transposase n=1 Tax=Paramecium sonneborni TaxID=65129 RepID=A0A8S1K0Y8_9CILI|nr:unnamed protein product [Paramecium sonneborni]
MRQQIESLFSSLKNLRTYQWNSKQIQNQLRPFLNSLYILTFQQKSRRKGYNSISSIYLQVNLL